MRDLGIVRRDARLQREEARLMRHRARRQRLRCESTLERLFAPQILAALQERDLSDLEDVRPQLRLIRGGRGS